MMKKLFLSFASFLFTLTLIAQPKASYATLRKDVGTLGWHEPGEAVFTLTNRGTSYLRIRDIVADCGCTTVEWEKKAIQPGESTRIIVVYDAELLGKFHKSIAVYTNAEEKPTYLSITGSVLLEKESYEGDFPYHIGEYALSVDNIEFDDVNRGDRPEKTFYFKNNSDHSVRPQMMHLPPYLRARILPEVIAPNRIGRVVLTLNSNELKDMGLTTTSIYFGRYMGDRVSPSNELNVTATLLPDLTQLTTPTAAAPEAEIAKELNLGAFRKKTKLKGELMLRNTGSAPLEIQALQVYNPGISVSIPKSTILIGESVKIKVTLSRAALKFKGSRRILLITNDPYHPKIVIHVKSEV